MAGFMDTLDTPVVETDMDRFMKTGSPAGTPAPLPTQQPAPQVSFMENLDTPAPPEPAPYDWKGAGIDLPDWMQPAGDLIAGLNGSLANITGLALDDIDIIMRDLGKGGIFNEPGTGRQKMIEAMAGLGIGADKTKAASEFLADMGESVGENLVMLSVFMAAAPAMMSAQGPGAISNFARQMGTGLVKHPGAAVAAEVGAGMMGEVGAQAGAQLGPTGEAIGGMAGALAGGIIPAAIGLTPLGALTRGVKQGVKGVNDLFRSAKAGATQEALVQSSPDVNLISEAIKSDQMKIERIIERLNARLTQNTDPIASIKQLQKMDRLAYAEARKLEDPYWRKANTSRKLSSQGLKDFSKAMLLATAKEGRSEWLPGDLMNKIKGLPQNVSIERMRAIRTIAFQRVQAGTVATPQGVLPMNDSMRRNLKNMIGEIDKQIESAYPNDTDLKQAVAFSRWIHDRFTRGPVQQFSRPRSSEGQLPPANQSARAGMRDESFGPSQADIADKLQMPQLEQAAQTFIRGRIQQEAATKGPEAGLKYMNSPEAKNYLKAYPKLMAELETHTNRLTKAIQYRDEVLNSAFIKAAGEGPEAAIKKAIASTTRVRDSKALYDRVKHNPDALEATQSQTILELERMAGGDPNKILEILGSPDTHRAVRTLVGPDKMFTLESIARQAAQLTQMDQGMPRYSLRKGSRFIGAWAARKMGSRTIQGPGVAADIAQKAVDMFFDKYEKDIFAKAIRYPEWRAILNTRIPNTPTEMNRLNILLKRAIRVEEAVERSLAPITGGDDGNQ